MLVTLKKKQKHFNLKNYSNYSNIPHYHNIRKTKLYNTLGIINDIILKGRGQRLSPCDLYVQGSEGQYTLTLL